MPAKLTQEEVIDKCIAKHGNRYDYSQLEYINANSFITIICREHGPFRQRASAHYNLGHGCPKCSVCARVNIAEAINRFKSVHGDKYDYSEVVYINTKTKVKIICPTHGPFLQSPEKHWIGQNCPRCNSNSKRSNEEVIKKAREVHGDKYDYSDMDYIDKFTKIKITCPEHGPFYQRCQSHLGGTGCPDCMTKHNSVVYLLKDRDSELYKIGVTSSLHRRVKEVSTDFHTFDIIVTSDFVNRSYAFRIEKELKSLFKDGRKYPGQRRLFDGSTEVFELTEEQVKLAYLCINEGMLPDEFT